MVINCVSSTPKSVVLLAGVSGAGKSTVLSILEDQGFFCIENLPYFLLDQTLFHLLNTEQYNKNIVISLAPHSFLESEIFIVDDLKKKYHFNLACWYITADRNVLIKRYDETRRRHPFSVQGMTLEKAIDLELSALESYAYASDYTLDTTSLSQQQLRELLQKKLLNQGEPITQIKLFSFGFKHGMPQKADYLFDVRSLINPYWNKKLRLLTGKDQEVIKYLESQPLVHEMIRDISLFITKWCGLQQKQGKSYIDIGIGCTGGQHRSVYVAEALYKKLSTSFEDLLIWHRELDK